MSSEIIKHYTPDIARHSRVSSELHQQHKSYFCEQNAGRDDLVSIKVKLPPWPRVDPWPNHFQECPLVRAGEKFEPATPENYEKFNHAQAAARPFYLKKNGAGRNARKVYYEGEERGTKLTFVTLPSYSTQALRCASPEEMRSLAVEVMKKFEQLYGAKVLSSNWHHDTGNYHLDIWFAEHDEKGNRYTDPAKYVGVWTAPRAVEVVERYRSDGFPTSARQLAMADAVIKRDKEKKPSKSRPNSIETTKFRDHWNVSLGKFLDTIVNHFCKKKGLAANIDLYRERWARVARVRAEREEGAQEYARNGEVREAELEDLRTKVDELTAQSEGSYQTANRAIKDLHLAKGEAKSLKAENQTLKEQNLALTGYVEELRGRCEEQATEVRSSRWAMDQTYRKLALAEAELKRLRPKKIEIVSTQENVRSL